MLKIIGILLGLTVVACIPGATIIGLFAGIVPGLVLLVAPTLLAYSLAALPARLITKTLGDNPFPVLAGLTLLTAATIALVPGMLSQHRFKAFARQYTAGDFAAPTAIAPRTFSIPVEGYSDRQTGSRPLCNTICQKLLFNASAEAVIIGSSRFTLAHQDHCAQTLSLIDQKYLSRVAQGNCLMEQHTGGADADVEFRWVERSMAVPKANNGCSADSFALWSAQNARTLEVGERRDGLFTPVERRSQISGKIVPMPLFILPGGCGMDASPRLAGWDAGGQSVSIAEVLVRRYNIDIERGTSPKAPSPTQTSGSRQDRNASDLAMISAARRILESDYASDKTIGSTDNEIVRKVFWAIQDRASAEKRELNDEEIELYRLAVRQHALRNYAGLERGAFRHPNALATLLPDIVDRLETSPQGREDFRWNLSNMIREIPAEHLQPYAARFGAILEDPARSMYANAIIERWGEISSDPVPRLLELVNHPQRHIAEYAYRGLCRINAAVDPAVARFLIEQLPKKHYAYPKSAVVALIRAGHRDRVAALAGQTKDTSLAHTLKWTADHVDSNACR